MAAAQAGTSPVLLLVDEVDAALDDVNQLRAGQLLKSVNRATGCQMWAVSHSPAFQGECSHFLRVKRGPEGTSMALVGSLQAALE